ncbi:MAG: hypothetical protein JXR94_15615 [Candidatus Hydrogenedentes bacterium]|nr:hypothetical protein [Candidatus Hydrogenedentota bacterium]
MLDMIRGRWTGSRLAAVAAAVCCILSAALAGAGEIRYHGVQIDEQNRVLLEEEDGLVRVALLKRSRAEGVAVEEEGTALGAESSSRLTDAEYLVEVQSEVLKPSAPNYLQNPGEAYRITFRGLGLFPDYVSVIDVDAGNARDVVFAEFERFWARSSGVYREALYRASTLSIEVLKEADLLPAEIMKSVLRSKSGAFRITEASQQRRSIQPMQVFAPEHESGRPEAGATMRAQEKGALPESATSYIEVRGVGSVYTPAGPRTPAAAAAAEAYEAGERASRARTGTLGRVVTWTPAGSSVGAFMPQVRTGQSISEQVPYGAD